VCEAKKDREREAERQRDIEREKERERERERAREREAHPGDKGESLIIALLGSVAPQREEVPAGSAGSLRVCGDDPHVGPAYNDRLPSGIGGDCVCVCVCGIDNQSFACHTR
jgi:hypothetical protein